MAEKKNRLILPLFLAIHFLLFLVFFIPFYVLEIRGSVFLGYAVNYIQEIGIWLLPPAAAVSMLVKYSYSDIRASLRHGLFLTLTTLIYTVPYYYLIGIANRLNTLEALTLLPIVAVLYGILFYINALALFFIARTVLAHSVSKELQADLPEKAKSNITKEEKKGLFKKAEELLPKHLSEGGMFDLSSHSTAALFAVSFAQFMFYFFKESFGTVSYLLEFAGDYHFDEIIYILFRFLFLLVMLFVSQSVCYLVKKFSVKPNTEG